jgi:ribosomal protein S18 acetylase RimI-like enzyme
VIAYRVPAANDWAEIDGVFRASFAETFAHLYDPADLAAFFKKFSEETWRAELSDRRYAFRIAEEDGVPAGYVKLGPTSLPHVGAGRAIELRQLYILSRWHGRGLAAALMDWALAEARRRGAEDLYLTVFVDNHRARRFYERYGFSYVGPYSFMVGNHADEDHVLRLSLKEPR